jgi:hypothetical protein
MKSVKEKRPEFNKPKHWGKPPNVQEGIRAESDSKREHDDLAQGVLERVSL